MIEDVDVKIGKGDHVALLQKGVVLFLKGGEPLPTEFSLLTVVNPHKAPYRIVCFNGIATEVSTYGVHPIMDVFTGFVRRHHFEGWDFADYRLTYYDAREWDLSPRLARDLSKIKKELVNDYEN